MRSLKIAVSIAALVAAIFILYNRFLATPEVDSIAASGKSTDVSNDVSTDATAESSVPSDNTVTPQNESTSDQNIAQTESKTGDDSDAQQNNGSLTPDNAASVETNQPAALPLPNPNYPELFGYDVGVADISEDDFTELVDRLNDDPALLADVLSELRGETDPARINRLIALLGATGSADVLPITEELVYSSSAATRQAGLDLLSRLAPRNAEAYDIANTILGSEADPKVLVATMNVLATPVNASADVRNTAISQIMPLAEHESVAVRRHSVAILPRLTNDETLSPILYTALSDTDASVREAATYSIASHPFQPPEAVERLLEMVEDPNETKSVRGGAIYALQAMSPNAETNARIKEAKIRMREAALNRQ